MIPASLIHALGKLYLDSPAHNLTTDERKVITDYIHNEYKSLPVTVLCWDSDPYSSHLEMFNDIEKNGEIKIFKGGTAPQYLGRGFNLMLRAVHDWHHYRSRSDFSFEGELRTWEHASCTDGPDKSRFLRQFLYSEIVAQAAAYHYLGDYPKEQKVVLFDFIH